MEQDVPKTSRPEDDELTKFVEVAIICGRRYLGAGGPTSRLEDSLQVAGKKINIDAEVFALPTGVTVSASKDGRHLTKMGRIQTDFIDLNEVKRMERILLQLGRGKLDLDHALSYLKRKPRQVYPNWLVQVAVFFIGFIASFPHTHNGLKSVVAGSITVVTFMITNGLVTRVRMQGIFSDFLAAFIALLIAKLASGFLYVSTEALAVGCFLILVPGLPLTTAISELTEQNVVSGTAKVMKGMLILFALGTAYLLFQDLVEAGFLDHIPDYSNVPAMLPAYLTVLGTACLVGCFCIKLQIPKKAVPWAVCTALLGWCFLFFLEIGNYLVLKPFAASLAVGLMSIALGKAFRLPSQIFSVPGIFSLLPGMLALSSVQSYTETGDSLQIIWQVGIIASAIVFGLFTARVPFNLIRREEF